MLPFIVKIPLTRIMPLNEKITMGISLPKHLVHLLEKFFGFQQNLLKIHKNPFVATKSRTLFRMSEMAISF